MDQAGWINAIIDDMKIDLRKKNPVLNAYRLEYITKIFEKGELIDEVIADKLYREHMEKKGQFNLVETIANVSTF